MRNYIALFSSGTQLTAQFPSHGLGEPVAYGFQTVAKGALHYSVVINMKSKHGGDVNITSVTVTLSSYGNRDNIMGFYL